MTRPEALALLKGLGELNVDGLDDIFTAFGFTSSTPSDDTEVYTHPLFPCGRYTARDDGHLVTYTQRLIVSGMVHCVQVHEATLQENEP